jgi:hypothetical protein
MDFEVDVIDKLILDGAIEVSGINSKDGSFLYSFTDKLQEAYPDLYSSITSNVYSTAMKLWEKGFIDLKDDDGELYVTITDKGTDEKAIEQLDNLEISILESIVSQIERLN